MPKKECSASKFREGRYPGNSEELKKFLSRKSGSLRQLYEKTTDKAIKRNIKKFIDKISDVLELDYFDRGSIMTMEELIKVIKKERKKLSAEMNRLKSKLDVAEASCVEAFNEAGKYMANVYEDEYNTPEQEKLRALYDIYDSIKLEYESYERPWRIRWWLLGIINRPIGFFKNVNT